MCDPRWLERVNCACALMSGAYARQAPRRLLRRIGSLSLLADSSDVPEDALGVC